MTAIASSPVPDVVLAASGLTVQYGSSTIAVHDLDLEVRAGEVVAILGSNGAGKTSLLRAFCGAVTSHGGRIVSGVIRHRGVAITHRPADRRVRRGIVQVPEGRQIFGTLTVEENLRIGAYCKRVSRTLMQERLNGAFDTFPILGDRRRQPAGLLSGGEQQMLAIARGMMSDPDVLLLDEPSLGLAPRIVEQVSSMLRAINDAGTSMLIVEQNAHVALELADRAYVLSVGESVLDGTAEELKASPEVQAAYLGGDIGVEARA